jgi:hypothetical protein
MPAIRIYNNLNKKTKRLESLLLIKYKQLWKPESIELLKENVKQYSPQAIKAVLD